MKRITSIILSIVLVSSLYIFQGVGFADSQQDLNGFIGLKIDCSKAIVNGSVTQLIDNDTQYSPFASEGRTYVPVRFVVQTFGGKVDWDNSTKEAAITVGNYKVVFKDGSNKFTANGETKTMDVKPTYRNGKMYIPVRFLVESIGKIVSYKDGYILLGDRAATDEDYATIKTKLGGTPVSNEPVVGVDVGRTNTCATYEDVIEYGDNLIYYDDTAGPHGGYICITDKNFNNTRSISQIKYGYFLNLLNGNLYYVAGDKVWKYNIDSDKTSLVSDLSIYEIFVTKDGIYYTLYKNGQRKDLWFMKLDGTGSKKLASLNDSFGIEYYDNSIYIGASDSKNEHVIYRYNLTSNKLSIVLPDAINHTRFIVENNKIYRSSWDMTYKGELMRNKMLVCDTEGKNVRIYDMPGFVGFSGGKIYYTYKYNKYINSTDYSPTVINSISRVDMDTGKTELIYENPYCEFYFSNGGNIYIFIFSDRYEKNLLGIEKLTVNQ